MPIFAHFNKSGKLPKIWAKNYLYLGMFIEGKVHNLSPC